jgi:hypothetical protein
MTALSLCLLALLDGLLTGFRAAAGQNGHVHKGRYYLRAQALGGGLALALPGVAAALAFGLLAISPAQAQLWSDFEAAGAVAMRVFAVYGAVAMAALGVYLAAAFMMRSIEVRTAATVIILGPFTLVRPWVILGGLLLAIGSRPRWEVAALCALLGATALAMEPLLRRMYRPRVSALLQQTRE